MTQSTRGRRREVVGQVISDKMQKTITVQTYRSERHPKYKKFVRKTTIYKVHDENNSAKVGDTVRIFETRALSKTKRWKLAEVVTAAKVGAEL